MKGKLPGTFYQTQFELLVQMNQQNDAGKATHLAISLRGPAAAVLTNLGPEKQQNYGTLAVALDSHFGLAHRTELSRMRLKGQNPTQGGDSGRGC